MTSTSFCDVPFGSLFPEGMRKYRSDFLREWTASLTRTDCAGPATIRLGGQISVKRRGGGGSKGDKEKAGPPSSRAPFRKYPPAPPGLRLVGKNQKDTRPRPPP